MGIFNLLFTGSATIHNGFVLILDLINLGHLLGR